MTEIWKTGSRYYYFSMFQFRTFPISAVRAAAMFATDQAVMVSKPAFLN